MFFFNMHGEPPIAQPRFTHHMTIPEWEVLFPSDDGCKAYLAERRSVNGIVVCPRCDNDKVYPVTGPPFHWQCTRCAAAGGYRFSVLVNTIFENTNIGLRQCDARIGLNMRSWR